MSETSVDLLEALRAALDEVEPLIAGRIVDIEMARLRVLVDPTAFGPEFASLIEAAVADTEPNHPLTVRVTKAKAGARIDVLDEREGAAADGVVGSITLPLAPGGSNAADA